MTCKFCIAIPLVHSMCIDALRVNDMTFKGERVKTCLAKLSAYEDDLKASFSRFRCNDGFHRSSATQSRRIDP